MVVHLDYTIENINGAVCGVVQRDQEPSCHCTLRCDLCTHHCVENADAQGTNSHQGEHLHTERQEEGHLHTVRNLQNKFRCRLKLRGAVRKR
jgi:hypothetical protein